MSNYKVALRQGINSHIAARVAEIKVRLRKLKGERHALTAEWHTLQQECTHPNKDDGKDSVCPDCGLTVVKTLTYARRRRLP